MLQHGRVARVPTGGRQVAGRLEARLGERGWGGRKRARGGRRKTAWARGRTGFTTVCYSGVIDYFEEIIPILRI